MKKLFLLTFAVFVIAGCSHVEKYADPRLRDEALLKAGLSYYGEDPEDHSFDDMYYAFAAREAEIKKASEQARAEFGYKVLVLPAEERSYLKDVFNDLADLAELANYSYKDEGATVPAGWTDLGAQEPEIEAILQDPFSDRLMSSGLKCSLMTKGKRQVLVFAGTDFPTSWRSFDQIKDFFIDAYEDIYGALNTDASQVVHAEKLVAALLEAGHVDLDDLEFAGHSLGGRLASEMSVIYGCPAVVFNAAGVSPDVYQAFEDARAAAGEDWRGYILDVVSANDPLTVVQNYMSGENDPFTTKLSKVLSAEKNTVDEIVSLGLDILGAVVDNVTGSDKVTTKVKDIKEEYGETVDRLYERDYRAIGAMLPVRENLTGHGIGDLAAALRARAQMCN